VSSCELPLLLANVKKELAFSQHRLLNPDPTRNFKKNYLDIDEFFHAEERTDKTNLIVVFAT
jgi:hypothetical protein